MPNVDDLMVCNSVLFWHMLRFPPPVGLNNIKYSDFLFFPSFLYNLDLSVGGRRGVERLLLGFPFYSWEG